MLLLFGSSVILHPLTSCMALERAPGTSLMLRISALEDWIDVCCEELVCDVAHPARAKHETANTHTNNLKSRRVVLLCRFTIHSITPVLSCCNTAQNKKCAPTRETHPQKRIPHCCHTSSSPHKDTSKEEKHLLPKELPYADRAI